MSDPSTGRRGKHSKQKNQRCKGPVAVKRGKGQWLQQLHLERGIKVGHIGQGLKRFARESAPPGGRGELGAAAAEGCISGPGCLAER